MISLRSLALSLGAVAGVAVSLVWALPVVGGQSATTAATKVTVYKTPTCGCCAKWEDHLREHGFQVASVDLASLAETKQEHQIPPALQSCHTAVVDGYIVEGHVPAEVVQRMLRERPEIAGIAVPGMPIGSPGMEVQGAFQQSYEIIAFEREGRTHVYDRR